jgi:hypothetical protein
MSDDIVAATLIEGSLKCWNMPFFVGFITFPDFLNKTLRTSIDFLYSYRNYNQKSLDLEKRHTITQGHGLYCVRKGHMQTNFQNKSEQ